MLHHQFHIDGPKAVNATSALSRVSAAMTASMNNLSSIHEPSWIHLSASELCPGSIRHNLGSISSIMSFHGSRIVRLVPRCRTSRSVGLAGSRPFQSGPTRAALSESDHSERRSQLSTPLFAHRIINHALR